MVRFSGGGANREARVDILVGWPGGDWQTTAKLTAGVIGAYLFLIWIASILWAYRDIRGRTRDPVSQLIGLSIVTALPLVGAPIYLVVRPPHTLREAYDRQLEQEAILSELHSVSTCPQCRRPVDDTWMMCAFCSHSLKQPCGSCDRLLMNAWRHCPYCGETLQRPAMPVPAVPTAASPTASNPDAGQPADPSPLELQPERRRRSAAQSAQSAVPAGEPLEAGIRARPRALQDE